MRNLNERNLNEPLKEEKELTTADIAKKNADVVPFARKVETAQESSPFLSGADADDMHHRWNDIQAGFVDEPRKAVEDADKLVARGIQRLAEVFSTERAKLEEQWSRGEKISTEDLRLVLQRYRTFFTRLLSV